MRLYSHHKNYHTENNWYLFCNIGSFRMEHIVPKWSLWCLSQLHKCQRGWTLLFLGLVSLLSILNSEGAVHYWNGRLENLVQSSVRISKADPCKILINVKNKLVWLNKLLQNFLLLFLKSSQSVQGPKSTEVKSMKPHLVSVCEICLRFCFVLSWIRIIETPLNVMGILATSRWFS